MIPFGDFKKMDIRVAEITKVEEHPDADKLLVITANVGDEEKQLVAGLKLYYSPDELIGRKIIVINNLEPAKLRGVESRGMLLAAQDGDDVVLLTTERDVPAGTKVL